MYFYDVYILKGKEQRGILDERRKVLKELFGKRKYKHLQLARTYKKNFVPLFEKVIKNEEDEGIVIKSKLGKIKWNTVKSPDVWWQIKARRPEKNYLF